VTLAQVKKEFIRTAILESAFQLFSERGYNRTTLQDIAQGAEAGVGNVYSYFDSKLMILYEVFEPWQDARYAELEAQLQGLKSPREKLRAILIGVWRDIPMRNIMLANSLMEALSSTDLAAGKPSRLLRRTEARLRAMLAGVHPDISSHLNLEVLPNLILMAYDGYVINSRLKDVPNLEALVDSMCDMILFPLQFAKHE
jgi:AcrR family transcriptional regulator